MNICKANRSLRKMEQNRITL